MNFETNVTQISPNVRRAPRHHEGSPLRIKGVHRLDLPENLPEESDQEQILRELLDDSHKRIRLLEAHVKRLRSALIETKISSLTG